MTRHSLHEELDPFDSPDDMDGMDYTALADERQSVEEDSGYVPFVTDTPMCLLGFGDGEQFCIRDQYGCHIEGCEHASPN